MNNEDTISNLTKAGVWLSTQHITLEHKLNNRHLSIDNKERFLLLVQQLAKCRAGYLRNVNSVMPRHSSVITNYFSKVDDLTIDLLTDKITIGEFQKERAASWREYEANFARVDREELDRVNREHQEAVAAAIRAGANSLNQSIQQQQAINAMRQQSRPIINTYVQPQAMTCRRILDTIRCF